jgi:hypothetical protein
MVFLEQFAFTWQAKKHLRDVELKGLLSCSCELSVVLVMGHVN